MLLRHLAQMHAESGDETIEDELEEPRYQEEFNRVLEEHPLLFNSSPPFLQRLRTCHDSAQPLSPCSARLSVGLYPEESNPVNRLTASSAPRRVRISLWYANPTQEPVGCGTLWACAFARAIYKRPSAIE